LRPGCALLVLIRSIAALAQGAGTDSSVVICTSAPAVQLFDLLGGTPDLGGTWSGPPAHPGTFDPASDLPGVFTYSVAGPPPTSANVTVSLASPVFAGTDSAITLCSNGPAVSLFNFLGGGPAPGGGWSFGPIHVTDQYVPGVSTPGLYTYHVAGTPCPDDSAVVTVAEVVAPDAGGDSTITLCGNGPPVDLFIMLSGTPDAGGSWIDPLGAALPGSTFTPGVSIPGAYTYMVPGMAPCDTAKALVDVTVQSAPDAGADTSVAVCSDAAAFSLFSQLAGTPDAGGSWTDPLGTAFPGDTFMPGVSIPGAYTYKVPGTAPCDTAKATVDVAVQAAVGAGLDGDTVVCSNSAAFNLFDVLGGTPDPGGSWIGPGLLPGGLFTPGTSMEGVYQYVIAGMAPCTNDTALATVDVVADPNAGIGRSITVCSSLVPIQLIDSLGGTPDGGGTWTELPGNTPATGVFTPSTPGTFTFRYTVSATAPCTPATSDLVLVVNAAPNAGSNASISVCTNSSPVSLFASLGGTPQSGGTWTFTGIPHADTFNPVMDIGGNYLYTVVGVAPCSSATATVTVTLNPAADAGGDGSLSICENDPGTIALFNVLVGSPDPGGSWTLNGVPVPSTYNPGDYTPGTRIFRYIVPGLPPCGADTAWATLIQVAQPDAGSDALLSLCTSAPLVDLFDALGGNPDAPGTWIDANNANTVATFDPAVHNAGTYVFRYIVVATTPCANDTAKVTITLTRMPVAGTGTAPEICSDDPPISLLGLLGGVPDNNGSWTYQPPLGAPVPHGPVFNPQTEPGGAYIYTVPGNGPCPNATATVQITLFQPVDAGLFAVGTACASETAVPLFPILNGTPQAGGTWSAINSFGHLTNGVFNPSGLIPGNYGFLYTLAGSAACGPDTASVWITVVAALNAGTDASTTLCAGQVVFLTPLLGGNPQPGGSWTAVGSSAGLVNGVLNAAAAGVGVHNYRYILTGSGTCDPDTAILTVTIVNGPRAGADGSTSVCSNTSNINLFSLLGGTYDMNGTWYLPTPGGPLGGSSVDPASGVSGLYAYIVPSNGTCPADTAHVTVTIQSAVHAGMDATLTICSNGDPMDLGTILGGTPDAGGFWTVGSSGPLHGPLYDPLVDVPGNYVYTVLGQSPCSNASASVFVTEQAPPMAGEDNSYSFCSSEGPFTMVQKLNGTPQTTGIWKRLGPPNSVHGPVYDPSVDSSGVFLYVVVGAGPCANDSALLSVTEVQAPDAGSDFTLQACPSDSAVDLFAALGATADSTGIWTDANGLPSSPVFNATVTPVGTYAFTYTVAGSGPCQADEATVTVEVEAALNPGIGGADTICGGQQAYDLFQSLGGAPDLGGTWSAVTGGEAISGHFFNASILPSASYPLVYTVEDPGCGPIHSTVDLFVTPFPDPGSDSSVVRCYNEPVFPLFSALGGDPQPGGSWSGPDGPVPSGLFDPSQDLSGNYVYTLPGNGYCPDTSATVTVLVNLPANAGVASSAQACAEGMLALFPLLEGNPQAGGLWTDLSASGALQGDSLATGQLPAGTYPFEYALNVPGCTRDSAVLTVELTEPLLVSEPVLLCDERTRTYTVSFTITGGLPGAYLVSGGAGTLAAQPPFVFISAPLFTNQGFAFTVDDPSPCEAFVLEGSTPCTFGQDIFVPESFTPNGDGVNDLLEIPGIGAFPANRIAIFNRWGGEVWSAAGYDNRNTVWDGTSPKAIMPGNCPTGTYYYVLELGDGMDALKGFIYLNR
jgi:gliding motility-associated-like protein